MNKYQKLLQVLEIVSHMTWHEVVSVIKAMYCIMQHECLEED